MSVQINDKRGKGNRPSRLSDGTIPPPWWDVFIAIEGERLRQLEKWGVQTGKRLDGTGIQSYRLFAEEYQRQNDARHEAGKAGVWAKILLEEVYEALAESDPDKLAHELVQVAAVATAWLEDLAYRKDTPPADDALAA